MCSEWFLFLWIYFKKDTWLYPKSRLFHHQTTELGNLIALQCNFLMYKIRHMKMYFTSVSFIKSCWIFTYKYYCFLRQPAFFTKCYEEKISIWQINWHILKFQKRIKILTKVMRYHHFLVNLTVDRLWKRFARGSVGRKILNAVLAFLLSFLETITTFLSRNQ